MIKYIVGARLSNAGVKLGTKAFNNCISLGKINNLSSASEIGAYAFNNCAKLNNVELGEDLKILKEGSFYGCVSLTRVELPRNLEHITGRVFYNCTNLKDVKIANEQAVIVLGSTNAFLNCSANLTISVPDKVLQIYLQDDNWKLFNVIN